MSDPIITKTSVTYSQSRKVNLGNYEAADVFISTTFESVEQGSEALLYAKAADFVEEKLAEEVAALQKKSLSKVTQKQAAKVEEKEEKDDGKDKEEKPKKASKKKAAKKSEPKSSDDAAGDDNDSEASLDSVKAALKAYSAKYSKDDAKAIIQRVTGQPKMKDIKEEHFTDILMACEEPPVEDEEDFDEE